jgi:hypothetical protein
LVLRSRGTIAVAIAFVVPLVVLLSSIRTSVGFWDTGDLQTVAWIAGIPYPTGYPGYVLAGWLWTHVLPIGEVAARLNALSAVAIAAGAAVVAVLALELDVDPLFATLSGWSFAFARVVWERGTYADVHPLGFALVLGALALGLRWSRGGRPRTLVAAILCAALALAVDDTVVLVLPGALLVGLGRGWPLRATALAILGGVVMVGAVYAYLPLRSAYVVRHGLDPTLALGVPPGRPYWDDHDPRTPDGFRALVTGDEWSPQFTVARILSPHEFANAYDRYGQELLEAEPMGLFAAAAIGVCFVLADFPLIGVGLIVATVVPALFGASYQAEADPERYVLGLYALSALGLAVVADRTARAFGRDVPELARFVVAGLLGLGLVHDVLASGSIWAARADHKGAELSAQVVASTHDDALVVASWNLAAPLAYRDYVQHRFGARVLLCALPEEHLHEYRRWMHDRQVVIVALSDPDLPGLRTRLLGTSGDELIYEVLP